MRHRIRRMLGYNFRDYYFKPRGIPLTQLDEIEITDEELETLRLRFIKKLDQQQAAKTMKISQSQYQRDITKTMEKITRALIEGKALLIRNKIRA
ncbi:DUF134 domain-containing protein [Candidatus Dojkabacteria bacterium]|nr:DUF134 domain-containing protein [Candidatus Dojkabacteria bacterium]